MSAVLDDAAAGPRRRFVTAAEARAFVLAGNARLTLVSRRTGARFTFRVRRPRAGMPHFVALLCGPDNDGDYQFLGTIFADGRYVRSRKSRIGDGAPSARAFAWAWPRLAAGALPDALEVWHEGRCGRCGRALTVPESIARGLGPECAGVIHLRASPRGRSETDPPQEDLL